MESYLLIRIELQAILFLHSCWYKLEAAKETIVDYFTLKTLNRDLFTCASQDIIEYTFSYAFIGILPKRTNENNIILLLSLIDKRPSCYQCLNHSKVLIMIILLYLHQFGPGNGLILVVDMQGSSLGHLFRLSVRIIKNLIRFLQLAAPVRIKEVHFMRVNRLSDKLVGFARPFLKREISKLMQFHSVSNETIFDYIPRECLPTELDGTGPSLQELRDDNVKNIVENLEFFQWHDNQTLHVNK